MGSSCSIAALPKVHCCVALRPGRSRTQDALIPSCALAYELFAVPEDKLLYGEITVITCLDHLSTLKSQPVSESSQSKTLENIPPASCISGILLPVPWQLRGPVTDLPRRGAARDPFRHFLYLPWFRSPRPFSDLVRQQDIISSSVASPPARCCRPCPRLRAAWATLLSRRTACVLMDLEILPHGSRAEFATVSVNVAWNLATFGHRPRPCRYPCSVRPFMQ